jgi:aspartate aminotransferase
MFDKTITVNGVAKALHVTGWRIGYIGADLLKPAQIQGQVTSGLIL